MPRFVFSTASLKKKRPFWLIRFIMMFVCNLPREDIAPNTNTLHLRLVVSNDKEQVAMAQPIPCENLTELCIEKGSSRGHKGSIPCSLRPLPADSWLGKRTTTWGEVTSKGRTISTFHRCTVGHAQLEKSEVKKQNPCRHGQAPGHASVGTPDIHGYHS